MNDLDFSPSEAALLSERAVAGAAMVSSEAAGALAGVVRPEQFWHGPHRTIFAAAVALADRGDPVDPITVLAELTRTGELEHAQGASYVHDCYAAATVPDAAWHARQVRDEARRREAGYALVSSLQAVTSPSFDPGASFDHIRKLVDDATTEPEGAGGRSMAQIVSDVIDGLERDAERGLPTGIRDLDDALNGLTAGQLVIVGARPSVGKSLMGGGIAMHAAVRLGLPVLLMSLEMSAEEITLRLLSSLAKVSMTALTKHQLTDADWDKLAKAAAILGDAPLEIDDTPGCSVAHITSRLRQMERTAPARLLVVDYLTLLAAPQAENRQVAVSELAWGLKQVARKHAIPVLVAAQVNRDPERRTEKRPTMSDLRESGALEAHADVVILLHREDMNDRDSPRAGEIDLIIDKQRQGPRCTVTAAFQGHYARIVDMAGSGWTPSSALEGQ